MSIQHNLKLKLKVSYNYKILLEQLRLEVTSYIMYKL